MRARILIGLLFLTAALAPLVSNNIPAPIADELGFSGDEIILVPDESRELKQERKVMETSGRAPCPAIQSDAGLTGDAGNDTNTSRPLGQNPTDSKTGCVDANDNSDWYSFSITQGKDIDVELTVPVGADFDLYLYDAASQSVEDYSLYNDPLEKVSSIGTAISGTAGTYYIVINQYSGDGQYTLQTWTNNSPPLPDLTATDVIAPARGNASDTVSVTYTIENIGNENSSSYDIRFILSDDDTYDWVTDTLLTHSETEPNIVENGTYTNTVNITLPSNLQDGAYHWLVWPDAHNNVSEKNDSNNYMASPTKMVVGVSCMDYHPNGQNDGNTSEDAPANWTDASTSMGSNFTGSLTGCMDGSDGEDVFRFDVPLNHNIEAILTTTGDDRSNLWLHSDNGSTADNDWSWNTTTKRVSSLGSDFHSQEMTYYLNISHTAGAGNYTLDIWTNYTTPAPNLFVEEVSSALNANPGDSITVEAIIGNDGMADLSNQATISAWLSVSNDWAEHDHEIGNTTISSLTMNSTDSVLISGTIPQDIIEGNYSIIVLMDQEDNVVEVKEDDNEGLGENQILIGSIPSGCPSQNDALSGSDAGNDANSAYDLGTDPSVELIGCADVDLDDKDFYKVTMSSGLDLSAILVVAPGSDFDIILRNSQGTALEYGYSIDQNDEEVETTDAVGGTFYLEVIAYSDSGEYRLLINDATDEVEPKFFCENQDDAGIGSDASDASMSPSTLGDNPATSGMGCMDSEDVADAFGFSLINDMNVEIQFTQGPDTNFMLALYEGNTFIESWDNTTPEVNWATLGTQREGTNSNYRVVVGANGGDGYYNLSIMTTSAALPDFVAVSVNCPIDLISGEEGYFGWEISNINGKAPADVPFTIRMKAENGTDMGTLHTGSATLDASNGEMDRGSGSYLFPKQMESGVYSCVLEIDSENLIAEDNETNNIVAGDTFNLTNYWDLWANDIDQDSYNTTDTGDGIVDACPETYGESTGDRFGCPDLDGDGWSNDNDIMPLDASQWVDSDGDGYGDNPSGTDGDQCPEVAGVKDGEGGQGCPVAAPLDADGDGVADELDKCPDTPSLDEVDETGCTVEVPDGGDGEETKNPTDGGDTPDSGDDTPDDGGDDPKESGDDESLNENVLGLSGDETMQYGLLAGAGLVIILLLALVLRGRGGSDDELAINQAFNAGMMGGDPYAAGGAAMRSPEAMAYEQQLIAAGYDAASARAYADHYFSNR